MEGILMVCFLLVEDVLSVLKSSEGRHCGAEKTAVGLVEKKIKKILQENKKLTWKEINSVKMIWKWVSEVVIGTNEVVSECKDAMKRKVNKLKVYKENKKWKW